MFDSSLNRSQESVDSTSRTLLERIRIRDAEAWQRFVHLYGPTIFGWARRASLQSHDAADVTQEVFKSVALNISEFRKDRPTDSFRGWLWVITTNKVRDHFRTRPAEAVGGEMIEDRLAQLPAHEPADPLTRGARTELAHRALELIQAEFETRTWQAFIRSTMASRTAADVAAELGMTPAAVHKAKSRVLLRLRRELDGLLE